MLAALFILVFLSDPIVFALGASGLLYLLLERLNFLITFPQRIWSGTNSFVMIAMPLFILAGELMNRGGLTKRLIDFCLVLVRPIRGGLGEVNVVASMIFGGISGSSVADTSALGSILIPAMIEQGYPKGFTVGVTVASSTMGMIIPPSIPMIMYAMISGASIGKLFLAGLIPGILIGISQLAVVKRLSIKHGYANLVKALDPKEIASVIKYGLFAVIMPIVLVLSISLGIATATESAAVAVLYACLVCFFV
jgi:tripartite ATP-independent transporter DctM subunit